MQVKLTRREATEGSVDAGLRARKLGLWPRSEVEQVCRNAHDAAPDDATKALVDLVRQVRGLMTRDDFWQSPHAAIPGEYDNVADALDRLRNTPEGAALIRRAEERDDG